MGSIVHHDALCSIILNGAWTATALKDGLGGLVRPFSAEKSRTTSLGTVPEVLGGASYLPTV